MFIAFILIIAAFIAAILYIFLIKRDIRQLGESLRDISQTETNAQLSTTTFDKDIVALADGINLMLERHKHVLLAKVQAESNLKRAITNISHDLRTPLTSAVGYMQMLDSETLDDITKKRYIEIIKGRLSTLSGLMNSLFEFTQVVEGTTSFNIRKINVCNLLRDVLSDCYPEFVGKGFDVDIDIPETPVFVLCDEAALKRVLQNVIRNVYIHGIDYMRVRLVNTEIIISNKARDMEVLDTLRLFERFYTSDASRTHKNTGLGLAISKELITRMNGSIFAETEDDMLAIRIALP